MKKIPLVFAIGTAVFSIVGCASTQNVIDRTASTKTYSPLEIISQESQKALQAQQILTKSRQEQNQTIVTNTKERLVYDANTDVASYILGYYSQIKPHSFNNYLSPVEKERQFFNKTLLEVV